MFAVTWIIEMFTTWYFEILRVIEICSDFIRDEPSFNRARYIGLNLEVK